MYKKCRTKINDTFVDEADFIIIAMHIYNLTEYSDNHSDTSGSLWQFKRDEIATNANVSNANRSPFKFESSLIGDVVADGANGNKEKAKIVVPLEYLSNFCRSLEMSLINCKVKLSLTWIENYVLSDGGNIDNAGAVVNAGTAATFKISDAKRYLLVVNLSTEYIQNYKNYWVKDLKDLFIGTNTKWFQTKLKLAQMIIQNT